jgi:teichoic acid transport system ATP-binding protein
MNNLAIKVENISKMYKLYNRNIDRLKEALRLTKEVKFRPHYALNDVSFQIEKGETVGIIGVNGAGKSTILKIITGVVSQTSGNLEISGRISALLELGAGFNMEYTGIENIYLNGIMIGFSKEEIDKKLDSILEFADIGEFVHQPVKTYSSGMFVRLAFAVAINIEPEILIVDEALSVGDAFFQAKCYKKFEEFKKEGRTILFVSHDLGSISKYCDRVVLLDRGVKLGEGTPKEMINLYKKALVNQVDNDDTGNKVEEEDNERVEVAVSSILKEASKSNMKQSLQLNQNHSEYGTKEIEIIDFGIYDSKGNITSSLVKGERFAIAVKLRAYKETLNPIAAFTITNLRGEEISGTNTMYENKLVGFEQVGKEILVTFTQEMNFQGGEYLLNLGCTGYEGDNFTVYHRLYDICNITVISHKNTVGFYDMNSNITVEELQ